MDELELAKLVADAAAVVERAAVPDDLRATAFAKAFDALSGSPSVGLPASAERVRGGSDIPASRQNSAAPEVKLAGHLGVSVDILDRVFDCGPDYIHFSGNLNLLGKTKTDLVGGVCLLMLAALKWSGLDGGAVVPDETVRSEIDNLGLLDVTNYTKHLALLRPFVTFNGSGKNATYKIKYDGLERAKAMAGSLLAGEHV